MHLHKFDESQPPQRSAGDDTGGMDGWRVGPGWGTAVGLLASAEESGEQ